LAWPSQSGRQGWLLFFGMILNPRTQTLGKLLSFSPLGDPTIEYVISCSPREARSAEAERNEQRGKGSKLHLQSSPECQRPRLCLTRRPSWSAHPSPSLQSKQLEGWLSLLLGQPPVVALDAGVLPASASTRQDFTSFLSTQHDQIGAKETHILIQPVHRSSRIEQDRSSS